MHDEQAPPLARLRRLAFWALLLAAAAVVHLPVLRRAPRQLSPAERALAAVARQALLTGDRGFDYGRFFLHTEGEAGGPVERKWGRIEASLREQVGSLGGRHLDTGIGQMMLSLFREASLGSYRREEARMSGFLAEAEAGGNCEAQTKLLLSSLRGSRLQLPEGKELAVEVFQDHVQPVIVDWRRKNLWNLMTGEEDAKPRADIYHPAILLSAYLKGLGVAPPIPDSKLLLMRGPRPRVLHQGWAFFTSSTMKLPASATRFAGAMPPERGTIPLPVPRGASSPPPPGDQKVAVSREEFLREGDPLLLFPIDSVDGPFGLVGSTLVFRDAAHAGRYLALATEAERRSFLLGLAEEQLRAELARGLPDMPAVERLSSWSDEALIERLRRIRKIERLVSLTEHGVDRGRASTMVAGELELRVPELHAMSASARGFASKIAREPEQFFKQMGGLDRASRKELLSFLMPRLQSAQVKALSAALADPARVALVAGDRRPVAAPPAIVYTEVELLDAPLLIPPPPAASAAAPASSAGAAPPPPPTEAVELPAGAYVDLVFSGVFSSGPEVDSIPVTLRWAPEASDYLKLHTPPGAPCGEALIQVQETVLRPLKAAGREPPAPLQDAIRRLERGCKR